MVIKGREVRSILGRRLGSWLQSDGFRKNRRGGWSKALGDGTFVVCISLSRDSDHYAGSQFTLELGREDPFLPPETRLCYLLSDAQLQEFHRIQTLIVSRLIRPDSTYAAPLDESGREYYNSLFEIPEAPSRGNDHWFRYAQPGDLDEWSDFILQVLPDALASAIEKEERRSQFPAIYFRMGPTSRQAWLDDAAVFEVVSVFRSLNHDKELLAEVFYWLTREQVDSALVYSETYAEEIEDQLADPATQQEQRQRLRFPGIVLADEPPRPRLRNSRGADVAEVMAWFRQANYDWESFREEHPHIRRGQLEAARLFTEMYL